MSAGFDDCMITFELKSSTCISMPLAPSDGVNSTKFSYPEPMKDEFTEELALFEVREMLSLIFDSLGKYPWKL